MSIDTMAFILGGLLVAVALLGGGLEVRELKIPSVGRISRLLCFIVGAVFIGLAVFLNPHEKETDPSADNTTSVVPQPVKVKDSEKGEWLTAAQYQQAFDKHVQEGFYPDKVEGRCESGSEQFHVEWKGIPLGVGFFSHHAVTKEFYERKNQEYVSKGYSLESLNKFKDCSGRDRYQATWFK
jgi:hypothetical protein